MTEEFSELTRIEEETQGAMKHFLDHANQARLKKDNAEADEDIELIGLIACLHPSGYGDAHDIADQLIHQGKRLKEWAKIARAQVDAPKPKEMP